MRKINFILWNLRLLKFNVFSGSHKNLFVGVISNNLLHLRPLKSVKKNAICLKICWYRVFVHWKWKLFNFLMDLVLKRTYSYVAFSSHILNFNLVPRAFPPIFWGKSPGDEVALICHIGTLTCHTLEIIYFYNKAMLLNFKKRQVKLKLKQNK